MTGSARQSRRIASARRPVQGHAWAFVLAVLLASQALAETPFPGHPPNRELLEIQSRVDSLFKAGYYNRAMVIYRKELAPLGDKYAQYMIGYMHLAGKGAEQDLATAAAWYRLAAERGQETFVRENQKLVSLLEPAQLESADRIFRELRKQYGDAALIMQMVDADIDRLAEADAAGVFTLGINGALDDARFDRLERQIRERLEYLEEALKGDEYADAADRERLDALERRATRVIRAARRGL